MQTSSLPITGMHFELPLLALMRLLRIGRSIAELYRQATSSKSETAMLRLHDRHRIGRAGNTSHHVQVLKGEEEGVALLLRADLCECFEIQELH